MIAKIKALPEKKAFMIGISIIVISPLLLFLFSLLFPIGNWITIIIQGIIWGIATLFVLSAADKRHSRVK
jgi:di/tricarboxylate transporter